MSYPYIFESNWEAGTNAEWDSETDTEGALNVRHYSQLARADVTNVGPITPYRGAYCPSWALAGDTSDHVYIEGDLDIADGATRYTRFALFLGRNLTGVTDIFNIYELQGTANAVEAAVGLRITTGATQVEIGVGQTAPTVWGTQKLDRGVWYIIELATTISTGVSGTSLLYVDGSLVATVDTLTNTAVLRGVLGAQDTLSTTTGNFYIDAFAFDDTRLYPFKERFPITARMTKSGHIFVGPGYIESVQALGSTGYVVLYDTDTANTNDENAVVTLDLSLAFNSFSGGAYFERGCYVDMTAAKAASIRLLAQDSDRRRMGPVTYGNTGVLRQYGMARKARNLNA